MLAPKPVLWEFNLFRIRYVKTFFFCNKFAELMAMRVKTPCRQNLCTWYKSSFSRERERNLGMRLKLPYNDVIKKMTHMYNFC